MPQLRFNKDKRGYENTYVVHPTGRRGKGRSRILYWFRTPPGVRVGRGPLDEEAIRLIEAGNPDLEFDWTRILKGQAEAPPVERRAAHEGKDRERRPGPERRKSERASAPQAEAPVEVQLAPQPFEEPTSPAHQRLGSEGLARLRARYSEMLARIDERIPEPERQDELKTIAERLNPDAWLTDSDVSSGLESYEATFASLRAAIPSRRV